MFRVGNSSLFQKKELSSPEFGREIVRLGFQFGVKQSEAYLSAPPADLYEASFVKKVLSNPSFLQLLYANLVTGSFYCYAKVLLHASGPVLKDVEQGIMSGLGSVMHALPKHVIENHKLITLNFATALEREITQADEESSSKLLMQYALDFYNDEEGVSTRPMLGVLAKHLSGLGSRFMAVCQDSFQLAIVRP